MGVPLIDTVFPVASLNVKPGGSDPLATDQLYGGDPPEAVHETERTGTPTSKFEGMLGKQLIADNWTDATKFSEKVCETPPALAVTTAV